MLRLTSTSGSTCPPRGQICLQRSSTSNAGKYASQVTDFSHIYRMCSYCCYIKYTLLYMLKFYILYACIYIITKANIFVMTCDNFDIFLGIACNIFSIQKHFPPTKYNVYDANVRALMHNILTVCCATCFRKVFIYEISSRVIQTHLQTMRD